MEQRRYQVFISSTFRDLTDERREVMQALLEMDCIPAGMELFPAASASAWELIRKVIEQSDYYVLVVAGTYGSLSEGISFTEREYDYAVSLGKHVIPFLHKNPGQIIGDKLEPEAAAREKLQRFRKRVEDNHTCKYWTSSAELGGMVSRGLMLAMRVEPKDGWVRGDMAKTIGDVERLANLQERVAELEKERLELASRLGAMTARLAPGHGKPKWADELIRCARRFQLEWEIESVGGSPAVAAGLITRTKNELLGVATEIDQWSQGFAYYPLQEVLRELSKIGTNVIDTGVWQRGSIVANTLSSLEQTVADWGWGT